MQPGSLLQQQPAGVPTSQVLLGVGHKEMGVKSFLVGRIFLARGGIFLARRNPCHFRRRFFARPL